MNEHPSPEFERELRETLNAPNANPVFVKDLRATLLERSKMKNQKRFFPRLAWGLAFAIVLIVFAEASPQVAEAMKRLWGYIPGIGFVESDNSLRLLSSPVVHKKDGITITIEQGAADVERVILLAKVDGYIPGPDEDSTCAPSSTQLHLPDGSTLELVQFESVLIGGKGDLNGIHHLRYVFAPIPPQIRTATLESPCILGGLVSEAFQIQLQFEFADKGQVMPVIELPTEDVMEVSTFPNNPTVDPDLSSVSEPKGFSIILESEAQLADGYLLAGSYQWTDERFDIFNLFVNDPSIIDANGQPVNFIRIDPALPPNPSVKRLPFAYQLSGKDHAWPLTISINSVSVTLQDQGLFEFDMGQNPQVGQVWDVNIEVPVGEHIVRVQSIRLIEGRTPAELGFEFSMSSDPSVITAEVTDINPIIIGTSGGGGGGGGGGGPTALSITSGWVIEGYSPAGVKTFMISDLLTTIDGHWKIEWQPASQ